MGFFEKIKSKGKVKKEDEPVRRGGKERTFDQARQLLRAQNLRPTKEAPQTRIRVNTPQTESYQVDYTPIHPALSRQNLQIGAHEINPSRSVYGTENKERPLPQTPRIFETEPTSKTNNETLQAENTRPTKHISLLERQAQESSNTTEKMRSNTKNLTDSWEQRIQKLEKDLEKSQSLNCSVTESLTRAERTSGQREKLISKIKQQLEERNESAQREVQQLQEEINHLMKKLDVEKAERQYELENLQTCHMQEQMTMEKSLKYELKDLQDRHTQEQLQMKRRLENEVKKFHVQMEENTREIESLHRDLIEARHAREESEHSKSSMREQLNAMEALLSQRESTVTELEQKLQDNTDMIAETKLILNQARNELNVEKRKARQASQEVADKNRKLEFLQQECARMSGDLIRRRYQ